MRIGFARRGVSGWAGQAAAALPLRASRTELGRSGWELSATTRGRSSFLVQTYAPDTGAFVTVVTVPVFVSNERWGAALVGWNEEGA